MTANDGENVVNFNRRNEREERNLKLLLDEGLRLLAAFKRIEDPATRATVTKLTEALARKERG